MYFNSFHPLSLIIFFSSIVFFTMITMNPVLLLLTFLGALFSVIKINKKAEIKFNLLILIAVCLTNPLFSHNGETVLFFIFGQRVTLESFFYGFSAGVLIIGIIYWFKLFSCVFKEDKLVWAIGKISPKLCVLFCMALRFIPLFKENARNIYNAQISLGVFDTTTVKGKMHLATNVFSALISLSMENAIETADTMRSRGFENKKRSSFSMFSFTIREFVFISFVVVMDVIIGYCLYKGLGSFYYYPYIRLGSFTCWHIVFYGLFAILSFSPLLIDILEDLKWKYLISKI